MNRIERLTAILMLLQDRPHSASEIARQFEVSKRTILRDVQDGATILLGKIGACR